MSRLPGLGALLAASSICFFYLFGACSMEQECDPSLQNGQQCPCAEACGFRCVSGTSRCVKVEKLRWLTAAGLDDACVGREYPPVVLKVAGGSGDFRIRLGQSSRLPRGLEIKQGALRGRPDGAGRFSFSLVAHDENFSDLKPAVQKFSLEVKAACGEARVSEEAVGGDGGLGDSGGGDG